jgi:hypothetical protein
MSNRRGPGDRQHDRGTVQQPGDRQLCDRGAVAFCNRGQPSTGPGQLTRCHREPWYKGQSIFFAVLEHVLVLSGAYIVEVLHADDSNHLACLLNLGGLYLTETNMADLALLLKCCNHAQRLFYGHIGIDPVQLPEVDHFRLEKTKAHLNLLCQVLRSANR